MCLRFLYNILFYHWSAGRDFLWSNRTFVLIYVYVISYTYLFIYLTYVFWVNVCKRNNCLSDSISRSLTENIRQFRFRGKTQTRSRSDMIKILLHYVYRVRHRRSGFHNRADRFVFGASFPISLATRRKSWDYKSSASVYKYTRMCRRQQLWRWCRDLIHTLSHYTSIYSSSMVLCLCIVLQTGQGTLDNLQRNTLVFLQHNQPIKT